MFWGLRVFFFACPSGPGERAVFWGGRDSGSCFFFVLCLNFICLNFSLLSNPLKKKKTKTTPDSLYVFCVQILHYLCASLPTHTYIEGQNLRRILWSLVSSLCGERGGEGRFETTISSKKSKFVGTHEDKNKILKQSESKRKGNEKRNSGKYSIQH